MSVGGEWESGRGGDEEWERGECPSGRVGIPDSRFPITDYRLPIPNYRFPITDSRFPITNSNFLLLVDAIEQPKSADNPDKVSNSGVSIGEYHKYV